MGMRSKEMTEIIHKESKILQTYLDHDGITNLICNSHGFFSTLQCQESFNTENKKLLAVNKI